MDWKEQLTPEERDRLEEIERIRSDLTAEHRRIYDRCRKRHRTQFDGAEMFTPSGDMFIIDHSDVAAVSAYNWFSVSHKKGGVATRTPYIQGKIGGRRVYLHRFLLGEPAGLVVDHIDGDPLNNCRANLRAVTHGENTRAFSIRDHF